jgi:hypothetical protein
MEAGAFQQAPSMHAPFSGEVQWNLADKLRAGLESAYQLLQKPNGVGTQRLGDREKFNDVQSSFAAFVLGDEGLGPAQLLRHFLLGKICVFASFDQQLPQGGMFAAVNSFAEDPLPSGHGPGSVIPI